jgi:cell division septation protein DedD
MKHISLIIAFFFAVLFSACGAKEETTEQTDQNAEVYEETSDTSMAYGGDNEFIDEGEFDPTDSTENMQMPDDNITPELVNEQENETTQVEENKQEEQVEEEVVKEKPKVHQEKFYIVVGSFKKFSNAQNLSNYFEKEGYKPMILPKVNGYNRVAISSYVEKTNAQKAVKRAREKYNDLTFWIYKW